MADRGTAGLMPTFPALPPAAEKIQVDLIALGAGDGVVVRAEDKLAPGLVQARGRIAGPGQPRERGQSLAIEHRDLRRALALLGIDVGDVFAGVDRVHVPGLRGDPDVPVGGLLPDGGEELAGYGRGGA